MQIKKKYIESMQSDSVLDSESADESSNILPVSQIIKLKLMITGRKDLMGHQGLLTNHLWFYDGN